MSQCYEEIFHGESIIRHAPGTRHEAICARSHRFVATSLVKMSTARLLSPRSVVQMSSGTFVRPDLALVTVATGKPWLLAEIMDSENHHTDTVVKKALY